MECDILQAINIKSKCINELTISCTDESLKKFEFNNLYNLPKLAIVSPICSIGDNLFSWCSSIKEIILPSTLKTIGKNAFERCKNLTKIIIPASVTSIGELSFNNCYFMTQITIPSSGTSIGKECFGNCSSLFEENSSLTSIEENCFNECKLNMFDDFYFWKSRWSRIFSIHFAPIKP